MEEFKVFINKIDYTIELDEHDEILSLQIIDKNNEDQKYKNFYTHNKLSLKNKLLNYISNNISDVKTLFIECIKKSLLEINIYGFFTIITFKIKKFPNEKKNFDIELFLYKTDSRQATLLISDLEENVKIVAKDNNSLKISNKKIQEEIINLTKENDEIENRLSAIKTEIVDVVLNKTNKIKSFNDSKLEEVQIKIKAMNDLIKSSLQLRHKSTILDISQLPILRPDDKKHLEKWFGLDFDMEKIYDSIIDSDSLESMRLKTSNKQQCLLTIEYDGRRFGCYTSLPFFQTNISTQSESFYLTDDSFAFIYSLDKRKKFKITDLKYVISFTSDGILVGSGPDIFISDKFSSNNKNFSNILGSYGKGEVLEESYTRNNYLAGIEYFKIKKIEIHQIIFK